MCQLAAGEKDVYPHGVVYFAMHELDRYSCHFERQKLKRYAANRNAQGFDRDGLRRP